ICRDYRKDKICQCGKRRHLQTVYNRLQKKRVGKEACVVLESIPRWEDLQGPSSVFCKADEKQCQVREEKEQDRQNPNRAGQQPLHRLDNQRDRLSSPLGCRTIPGCPLVALENEQERDRS